MGAALLSKRAAAATRAVALLALGAVIGLALHSLPGSSEGPAGESKLESTPRACTSAYAGPARKRTTVHRDDIDPELPPAAASWRPDALAEARKALDDMLGRVSNGQFTMVSGPRRLATKYLVENVLTRNVSGDFVEAGVAGGGMALLMAAGMRAFKGAAGDGAPPRTLYLADHWRGLEPHPDKFPPDAFFHKGQFHVSYEQFKANVRAAGFEGDPALVEVRGDFRETLKGIPSQAIAFLRVDGDMYESTYDALAALYDRVADGGWVYIDDYWEFEACRAGADAFLRERGITLPMYAVDEAEGAFEWAVEGPRAKAGRWEAAFWKKC